MGQLLKGKNAVVTGSSSGIGHSIALCLAEQGANVVINARGGEAVEAVVKEIRGRGGTAVGVSGPVNDAGFAESLVEACISNFGSIDILINNAGVFSPFAAADCPLENWRDVVDINLNGIFYTSHFALPHMIAARWGRVLNASSRAGLGVLGGSAYAASKSAVVGLSKAMAADYGRYGITVNAYNPEAVTPMAGVDNRDALLAIYQRWQDRGYLSADELAYRIDVGGPDGVAAWIAYLCSDKAENINGQLFSIDGRCLSVMSKLEEQRMVFRDYAGDGPWSVEELVAIGPTAFPLGNQWPRRTEEELAAWEAEDRAAAG